MRWNPGGPLWRWLLLPLIGLVGLVVWFALRADVHTDNPSRDPGVARPAGTTTRPERPQAPAGDAQFRAQEKELSDLVASNRSIALKAGELLARLPALPPDLQELAAGHAAHLAEGAQLNQAVRLLSDRRVSDQAREILFSCIYNQEPLEASGLLIQILEEGPEKYQAEAERTLSTLLQADHGRDVAAWKKEWAARKKAAAPKP